MVLICINTIAYRMKRNTFILISFLRYFEHGHYDVIFFTVPAYWFLFESLYIKWYIGCPLTKN